MVHGSLTIDILELEQYWFVTLVVTLRYKKGYFVTLASDVKSDKVKCFCKYIFRVYI
jgi:hypothetical protein